MGEIEFFDANCQIGRHNYRLDGAPFTLDELARDMSAQGIARRLVCDEAQAGVYAQPENPQAIADAITALADDPPGRARLGRNGRAWVMANATREALASRDLEHLDAVVKGGVGAAISRAASQA